MKRVWIFVTLLLAATSVYVFRDRLFYSPEVRSSPSLKAEIDHLKTSNDASTVAMALARLSAQKTPEGRKASLVRAKDKNPAIRVAAARALVFYSVEEPEIKAALETLLSDPDLKVRLAVIESLRNRPEDERVAMLIRHLTRTDVSLDEKLMANFALFQTSRTDADRQTYLAPTFQMAQDENSPQQGKALTLLVRVARRDKKAEDILRKELNLIAKAQNTAAHPYASTPRTQAWPAIYRYFLMSEQTLIKSQFIKYVIHPDALVRAAALTTIVPLCPPNRWEALKSFPLNKTDLNPSTVNLWLSAIDRLGGKRATLLLEARAKELATLPESLANRVTQIANRSRNQTNDACERLPPNMRSRIRNQSTPH